jgi:hypothetical protein
VSRYYAHHFDSRPKTWKLIGEALQHIGTLFMIATPFCPSYMFLPLAGIGNAFRAASFLAWGATTALFERNLAKSTSQLADMMVSSVMTQSHWPHHLANQHSRSCSFTV